MCTCTSIKTKYCNVLSHNCFTLILINILTIIFLFSIHRSIDLNVLTDLLCFNKFSQLITCDIFNVLNYLNRFYYYIIYIVQIIIHTLL